jgi:hypothetical protein
MRLFLLMMTMMTISQTDVDCFNVNAVVFVEVIVRIMIRTTRYTMMGQQSEIS